MSVDNINSKNLSSDYANLMRDMGGVLVNSPQEFIDMLEACGISHDPTSNLSMIDAYSSNLPTNDDLKVCSVYLLSSKESNFNGEVDNEDIYYNYDIIYNYFDWDDVKSNIGGVYAKAVEGVTKFGSKIAEGQHKKKFGALDIATKQAETKNALIKSVVALKQAESDLQRKKAETRAKNQKTLIIGGSIVGSIAILGLVIYLVKKNKNA